jgi:predicted AAA+ superfamily ATPase
MNRQAVFRILESLNRGEIVQVTGVRGAGKSSVLKEVEDRLRGTEVAFVDLEDPRLSPRPRRETLELFSKGKHTVLLDEVGRIAGWLEWARNTRVQVAAARSGPAYPGALPAGVVNVSLHPVDLRTWVELTGMSVDNDSCRENLPAFLTSTGLPGARDDLLDLFHKILFFDVFLRKEVRGADRLLAVAVYLLSNTARQVSASKMKGLLSRSVDQARAFLAHLQDAGLVYLVPRIEDSKRDRAGASRLCFSADLGLSVMLAGHEPDLRDLAATAVFHQLLRRGIRPLAWRVKDRLGLAVMQNDRPALLIDVSYSTGEADARPLRAAMSRWKCNRGLMLTESEEGELKAPAGTITCRPLWSWLLESEPPLLP